MSTLMDNSRRRLPSQRALIAAGRRGRRGRPRLPVEITSALARLVEKRVAEEAERLRAEEAERLRAEAAMRRAMRMYATLSATNEAIMRVDSPQALFDAVCRAAVEGGGLRVAAVMRPAPGSHWLQVVSASGVPSSVEQLKQVRISIDAELPEGMGSSGVAFRSGETQTCNDYLGDASKRPWHTAARNAGIGSNAAVPFRDGGRVVGVLLFFSDERDAFHGEIVGLLERLSANVTFALDAFDREAERKQAQQRIHHLATHDALTGLPNRAMFGELLEHALHASRRYHCRFALLFIDLDGFKTINDTMGHAAGDQLLQQVAVRFKRSLRATDLVARLGGDEFVVLMNDADSHEQVTRVARKLLDAAARPVSLLGQQYAVSASIGIAMHPGDGDDAQSLMKNADAAMYLAKRAGKNGFEFCLNPLIGPPAVSAVDEHPRSAFGAL